MALWHGMVLMVVRAAVIVLAENMQRFAQRKEPPNRFLNALGVALQVVTAPIAAIAYSVAPQSMLAPFRMVGMPFNFLAAQGVHGDSFSIRDVGATALILVGTTTCMLYGVPSGGESSAAPDAALYATYAACVVALCVPLFGLLFVLRGTGGPVDALANAALGGIMGSMTVVASKFLGEALATPGARRGVLSILVACVPVAVVAPTHLCVMNRGFGRHPVVFMSPIDGAAGLLANIATGRLLYSEVPEDPPRFAYGVALLCSGVALLVTRKGAEAAVKRE